MRTAFYFVRFQVGCPVEDRLLRNDPGIYAKTLATACGSFYGGASLQGGNNKIDLINKISNAELPTERYTITI